MNKHTLPENGNRITVRGKFLYAGNEKFYIKGVTYGTFAPDPYGHHFPNKEIIEKDFALMAQSGINSVRTYTVPPAHLLDIALKNNLKVMVGMPWEQHITFLDDSDRRKNILKGVVNSVKACGAHPAILCFTIGNEIPAPIVRWYGKKKIEKFLHAIFEAIRKVDQDTLVTYVNYPTTEYLDLSFLDFDCFNVYLETPEKLSAYLQRLHSLSGNRPLVLAEIGLDSARNGEEKQAEVLRWQIEKIFSLGCAGMFVFAWTDEWWRGGFDISDWDFGIVKRDRQAKAALQTVTDAWNAVPATVKNPLPKISVVVCTYNGSATIKKCLEGILQLDYPDFEVIVVNDGSTDHTREIVRQYPVKLITTLNNGLSNARNTGMNNSTGDIIAYIDDDAYPDRHWLTYLAYAYENSDHACIGGPNIAPYDDELISTCVANAPGGPIHVMLTDDIAEHVPGCNMTFRASALRNIGGFDPIFRNAGDDVDVCWRIQDNGGTIGFHPSALVWHHRRNSLKAYWKQQKGYGKAEALLESKWPEKYNSFGHITWGGRIYGNGATLPIRLKKEKIFHGTWGTSLFQSVYSGNESFITSIPLMPEWYLITLMMGVMGVLGLMWSPLLFFFGAFAVSITVILAQSIISAKKNSSLPPEKKRQPKYMLLIILLHLIQPVARLYGRLKNGLTPWRKRGAPLQWGSISLFKKKSYTYWSEEWKAAEDWLQSIEKNLIDIKSRVRRGGEFDNWDLEVKTGLFSKSRAIITIEEHGSGKQLLRLRSKPVFSPIGISVAAFFIGISVFAGLNDMVLICTLTALFGTSILINLYLSALRAMNNFYSAFMMMTSINIIRNHITGIPEKPGVIIDEKKFTPNRSGGLLNKKEKERIE